MLTDQSGNIVKPGDRLVVNMASSCLEVEVLEIQEGGMTLAVDKQTGQQVIAATQVHCKMIVNSVPGQPLNSAWKIVKLESLAAKEGN